MSEALLEGIIIFFCVGYNVIIILPSTLLPLKLSLRVYAPFILLLYGKNVFLPPEIIKYRAIDQ